MNTSYFAKYRGDQGVSIANSAPIGFKGQYFSPLVPPWSLVKEFKNNGDKSHYIKVYNSTVLAKLDPETIYLVLQDKVLLCWEKPGSFCHRRLVASWLEKFLNVEISELEY